MREKIIEQSRRPTISADVGAMSDGERSHSLACLAERVEAEVNEMADPRLVTAAWAVYPAAAPLLARLAFARPLPGSTGASLAPELEGQPLVTRPVPLAHVTTH